MMGCQTTFLTCHKGVDLQAATALRVMRDRLPGGRRLIELHRGDIATFWSDPEGATSVSKLLQSGRTFNPNKHHYGHFERFDAEAPWFEREAQLRGAPLPADWPGRACGTDLAAADRDLFDRLLGGPPGEGRAAVDVCAFGLGQHGPLVMGVVWRLVLGGDATEAVVAAESLIVTRSYREGLLVNPHMQCWLLATRNRTEPVTAAGSPSGRSVS
jgi:hypothetical protein